MNNYEKDELDKEAAKLGVYILDKKIYLKDGKIVTEYHGLMPSGSMAYVSLFSQSNEEIIHVSEASKSAEIKTNGEIIKTKNNTIIIWPSSAKVLTWTYIDKEKMAKKDNLNALFEKHREEQK
jgi:hypothetical protein